MKTSALYAAVGLTAWSVFGQLSSTTTATGATVDSAAVSVVALDANSSTVNWTEQLTNAVTGEVTARSHIYVTVGTGLNYRDESGNWEPSQDLIELTDDGGAAARRGPVKVYFSPNLHTAGAISLTTVSNRVFRSHPLGLYYANAETGERALIAQVKDSIGELHPPNQLIYPDCLDGGAVKADYRVNYTKAGMEADLVLLTQLPPPELFFGTVNPSVVRVEWVTEFLDPPAPQIRTNVLKRQVDATLRQAMVEPDLVDETLDFSDLWFPLGRALEWQGASGSDSNAPAQIRLANPARDTNQIFVAKQWVLVQQRQLLVESVDLSDLAPKLASLPEAGRVASAGNLKERVTKGRQLPQTKVAAKRSDKAMKVAAAPYRARGFLWDYIVISGPIYTDYTFASGTTYYIESSYFSGGTVTFQPNCIIKGNTVLLFGPPICNGTTGSPSILTSKNDDLFGEKISGSTGNPSYSGNPALWLYYLTTGASVGGVKIRWAQTAVQFDPTSDSTAHTFQGSRLEQCQTGLYANSSTVSIESSTKCGVTTDLDDGGCSCSFTGSLTDSCGGDTDSDGLPDSWEITYFGNISSQNGTGDPDGDGVTNYQEYLAGTHPNLKVWITEPKTNSTIP